MDKEQTAIERRKIMDRGTRMLDAIAATKGENDPMFWSAMAVMLEQVDEFDRRHGLMKWPRYGDGIGFGKGRTTDTC